MNAQDSSIRNAGSSGVRSGSGPHLSGALIAAGLISWIAMALGFFGLRVLMQERPEFVGEPVRGAKTDLVQESPRVAMRKQSDDIAVIKPAQPEFSEITFDMRGRRDYRGLQTIVDMSGDFHARYRMVNSFEEPIFLLFKCPHPKTEGDSRQSLQAGSLKLQASIPGIEENSRDAWIWSGTVEPRGTVNIEISYRASSLKRVTYSLKGQNTEPIKQLRVEFARHDLTAMQFESGEGPMAGSGEKVIWERRDFLAPDSFSASIVESRNLFGSLLQLLEIGPVVCLLFLLAVSAVVLARQPLTAVQIMTISAGYAFYFPLMLYLSSRFSFKVALVLALIIPGALLLNYARLLLGARIGLLGGVISLLLYQLFPTLAAFAGWNRGMVLLCLGVVTFAVLINLQNQALRKTAAGVASLFLCCCVGTTRAAEVQVIVPGQFLNGLPGMKSAPTPPLLLFEPAEYRVSEQGTYFRVEAKLPFQVLLAGDAPAPLFTRPVHLEQQRVESAAPGVAQLVTVSNRAALLGQGAGSGVLHFSYRVPIENHEGRKRAEFPLLAAPSGNVQIDSVHSDLVNSNGTVWEKTSGDERTIYKVGVAGEESLAIEWHEGGPSAGSPAAGAATDLYGIGITRARHLTVINSDSSCTHFAEFELPASQTDELRLRLPRDVRLISVSLDGVEVPAPRVEDQLCRIRPRVRSSGSSEQRFSFRLAYPPIRLGFLGSVELTLPEVFQIVGTLEWSVALPSGFETQIISSGLEVQKTPPDLAQFGDYGRILKSHPQSYLAKDLAPPGAISVNLRYRQTIPWMDGP